MTLLNRAYAEKVLGWTFIRENEHGAVFNNGVVTFACDQDFAAERGKQYVLDEVLKRTLSEVR